MVCQEEKKKHFSKILSTDGGDKTETGDRKVSLDLYSVCVSGESIPCCRDDKRHILTAGEEKVDFDTYS